MTDDLNSLIEDCQKIKSLCLFIVSPMADGCWLMTDSGRNKRYVIGRLDDGSAFIERARLLEQ